MTRPPDALREAVEAIVAASGLRGAAARELFDDLEGHVLDALDAGRTPDEILARLGNPVRVAPLVRRAPPPAPQRPDPSAGESAVRAFVTDLRHGIRTLRRAPTLALTATVVLGLGIAANAVAFSVLNEFLLRPLPVAEQESLVDVWADVSGGDSFAGFGWRDFLAYRAADGPLESLSAYTATRLVLGEGSGGRRVVAQFTSREYMPMLGVSPALGTLEMGAVDEGFGQEAVAVLSHALWAERFGSDRGIVGRTIRLDGRSVTVVGVGSEGFRGHFIGFPVDLWLPIGAADRFLPAFDPEDRGRMPFELIGRLRPGATAAAAREALASVAARLEREFPETHRGHGVGVTPTTGLDHSLRGAVKAFVAILSGAAALVLIVACLNVGGILLVRALSREREMAIRLALGAANGRLVRQLLAESVILAGAGALVGLGLAVVFTGSLAGLLRVLGAGVGLELPVDARVVALTAGAGLLAALGAGAAPALHLLRKPSASVLRSRGPATAEGRARDALLVGQVAVSVTLVIATALFVRALAEGLRADPGFPADRVATFAVDLAGGVGDGPSSGREDAMARTAPTTLGLLLDDLAALPGVEAVSVADVPPVSVARTPLRVEVPGVEAPPGEEGWVVDARRVGARYLGTLGIPLMAGRDIEDTDARDGPAVAVVSQAFVRRFWPDGVAVGRSFVHRGATVRVVGVAADVRYMVQDETPDPFVYLSLAGSLPVLPRITLRAPAPASLSDEVRRVVDRHAPGRTSPVLSTPRQVLDLGLLPQRIAALVVGAMGMAALVLAAVGLYGLVQYTVSRKRHELAVRLALGGTGAALLPVVLGKGLLLVAVGTTVGVGLAALGAPALSGFLGGAVRPIR